MSSPEFNEKLSLHESVRVERMQELDDAAIIIRYHAQMMGVDINSGIENTGSDFPTNYLDNSAA
jgi:hypothetical protein